MRHIKLIALFIMITSNSVSIAFAEDSKSILAIEYLKLSKTQESLNATIDTYVNQLASDNPQIDKDRLRAFFNSYMGWEVIREQTIKIVADTFTEDELKAIIDFYKSKYGITYADKSSALSAALAELIGNNMNKVMTKIQQKSSARSDESQAF